MKHEGFAAVNFRYLSVLRRGILIVGCAALVSACSVHETSVATSSLEQQANSDPSGKPGWMSSFASVDRAQKPLARLPDGAGNPREVKQHIYSNGVQQVIRLGAEGKMPAASAIEISIQASNQGGLDDPLNLQKPTESSVKGQIAAAFPSLAMRVVAEPRANRYGPYGLAIGKANDGSRCIFAWQWLDRDTAMKQVNLDGTVSLHVRLCGKDTTLDQLGGYIDSLEIRQEGFSPVVSAKIEPVQKQVSSVRRRSPKAIAKTDQLPTGAIVPVVGTASYLAPVADAAKPTEPGANKAMLDPSLPAEAYRGPSAQTTVAERH